LTPILAPVLTISDVRPILLVGILSNVFIVQ
jgi:hypothetical protein